MLSFFTKSAAQQPSNVLSHWYVLAEGVQFSSREFYSHLETELCERQLPHLYVSRAEFHEGSVLSDKRAYLRLSRERYAFDVCAAPFGTGYFFSLRFIEMQRSWMRLLIFLLVLSTLAAALFLLRLKSPDSMWIAAVGGIGLLLGFVFVREARHSSTETVRRPPRYIPDLDEYFLNMAVIGYAYEQVRRDTYHRYDTRLLFQTTVTEIVKRKAGELISEKGVKLLRAYEYSPVLGGEYKLASARVDGGANTEARHAVN